jgi:mannosyltransferase OCH1-like enzyme
MENRSLYTGMNLLSNPVDIPKIIWQTHNYEYSDLPIHFKKIAQTWKNLNPGWEYRYVSHTEREEIVKKYPMIWKYYPTQDGVCQADIWRYLVTYEHGGVYADMDSVCTEPISYTLSNLGDHEIFVSTPIISDSLVQDKIDIMMSRNFNENHIKFRLKVQANRNGAEIYDSENGPMIRTYTTKSSNYAVKKHSKIMKQVIKESREHLIKNISEEMPKVMLYIPFLNVIHGLDKDPSVSFQFNGFCHDDLYKTGFESDFWVNDYGTKIKYTDYLNKHNLPMVSD